MDKVRASFVEGAFKNNGFCSTGFSEEGKKYEFNKIGLLFPLKSDS